MQRRVTEQTLEVARLSGAPHQDVGATEPPSPGDAGIQMLRYISLRSRRKKDWNEVLRVRDLTNYLSQKAAIEEAQKAVDKKS